MIAGSDRWTNALSPDGLRFDGPDDADLPSDVSFGVLRRSRRFFSILPGGFAV
jgi:hypothetical protein